MFRDIVVTHDGCCHFMHCLKKEQLRLSKQKRNGRLLNLIPTQMKRANRDLLVLVKDETMNEKAIEREISLLNELLYSVESHENVSRVCEVIDVNRHKIQRDKKCVLKVVKELSPNPFIFLNILN